MKQGATFGIGTVVGDTNLEPQSPLVSRTAPLPLHQSNVDVDATFGVSLSTVGDLKVLITDIDPGKYEELLSGMTNDKRKVVFDALGAMCDLIKAESASRPGLEFDGTRNETSVSVTIHTSSPEEEVLIHSIDDVATLFGVPLNSLKDIDEFTKDLEVVVDINTYVKSYAGDAGTSAKDQPKVNSNFCHLVADLVFDGFSISIPCKVIEKSRSSFDRCLIKVNSEADLVDVVTIGIPSLTGYGFTKETIHVEYEWRPYRCDICKIFGHVHNHCPKKVKKRKGKSKSNNGGSVKQTIRYEPKVTTSAPKKGTTNEGNASISSSMLKTTGASSKKDNISTSNTFSALNNDEEDEDKAVENVYDESDNLFPNTKTGGNSSFTVAYG
ncbi:zinc knuckle CX2CX4HX4C containing protein [Tanacetum coccineum]|uniref:Zinc knuckle CX2CX4HX4C containing protein n=1 Tax=Tanacetum coccineum TaxID=301880 RepID=A0ABQ5BRG4_9ASTR